jgi:uncharacterized protein
MKNIYSLLIIFTFTIFGHAQRNVNNSDTISNTLLGVYDINSGSLKIRWYPSNLSTLYAFRQYGFKVERYILETNSYINTYSQIENSKQDLGIFQINLGEIHNIANSNNYAKIVEKLIINEDDKVHVFSGTDIARKLLKKESEEESVGFLTLASNFDYNNSKDCKLGFEDYSIDINTKYYYKLLLNLTPDEIEALGLKTTIDELYINTYEDEGSNNQIAPSNLIAVPANKQVLLAWELESFGATALFNVEISSKENPEWVKANTAPILPSKLGNGKLVFSYTKKLDQNDVPYFFRVFAVDVFGRHSPYSEEITAAGKNPPIEANPLVTRTIPGFSTLQIDWEFPAEYIDTIQKFMIYGCTQIDGEYTLIQDDIRKIDTSITFDISQLPNPTMYYKVVALDNYGYERESYPTLGQFKDETAPAVPAKPTCVAKGDNGDLTISWTPNTDSDLMGYRLFASDKETEDYIQFTPQWVKDTIYEYNVDIHTLTKYNYFKVASLDFRENLSALSEPCRFKIPDIIPPANPLIIRAEGRVTGNYLAFELSPSEDVVRHHLERKEYDPGAPFQRMYTIEYNDSTRRVGIDTTFLDTLVEGGLEYIYRLVAVDESGLVSSSNMILVRANGGAFIDKPINYDGVYIVKSLFQAQSLTQSIPSITPDAFIFKKETNILTWNYPTNNKVDLKSFTIYRSSNATHPIEISTIPAKEALKLADFLTNIATQLFCVSPGNVSPSQTSITNGMGYGKPTIVNPTIHTYSILDYNLIKPVRPDKYLYYWIVARDVNGRTSEMLGPMAVYVQKP